MEPNRWRFWLRQGVKFHQGQAFTADDVVFSVTRAQQRTSNYGIFVDTIDRTVQVEPLAVDIITRVPDPILPNKIASLFIMSRSWAEQHNATRPRNTSARVSPLVGISATVFATLLGVTLGRLAGYVGGARDGLLIRICDIQLTFPSILVALLVDGVVRAALPRDVHAEIAIFVVSFAIGISEWPKIARTVRGSTRVERNKEYVQAARVIGVPRRRIRATHVLPKVLGPVRVVATLNLGLAILSEATLSFRGVGVPPAQPSLGTLIRTATTSCSPARGGSRSSRPCPHRDGAVGQPAG